MTDWGPGVPNNVGAAWESFSQPATATAVEKKKKPVRKKRPIKKEDDPLPEPKNASALNVLTGATFASTNEAAVRLMKRGGAVEAAQALQRATDEAPPPAARATTKRNRKAKGKDEASSVGNRNDDDDDAPLPASGPPAGAVQEELQMPRVMALEEHTLRDNHLKIFTTNVTRQQRPTTDNIITQPPQVNPLQQCAKFAEFRPMVENAQSTVAADPAITYQRTPAIRRSTLVAFLCEPDPDAPYERPCINLDRDPLEHETLDRCASHIRSAKLWGPEHAFRARELLFEHQVVRINEARKRHPANHPDVLKHLPGTPEMCYMCHVRSVFVQSLQQKNNERRRQRKDLTVTADAEPDPAMLYIFNRFVVMFDVEGEYARNALLTYDDVSYGISGAFPRWNEENYLPREFSGGVRRLRGFEEHPRMGFQQARESEGQIECKTSGATNCTPSAPTAASLNAANSHH